MANHVRQSPITVLRPIPAVEPFAYAPLDHRKASIRLIRVLPTKSPEGYIECEIRHTSVDDSYICLSYVWGDADHEYTILLDNKPFRVRSNLHDFLERASRKERLLQEWLWIDALCIDQTNVRERNHQVQQMGLIFSRAKEVLSWLGKDERIAIYLASEYETSRNRFIDSTYWQRAWITQEIALARRVTLCAGNEELGIDVLQSRRDGFSSELQKRLPTSTQRMRGRSLIYLMGQYRNQQCHERRDRVYSLLALCGEGSDLEIDYSVSEYTLAARILRCCKQSFCLCSIKLIGSILGLQSGTSRSPEWAGSETFASICLPFVRETFTSSTCDSGPSRLMNGNGIAWSNTLGFILESQQDRSQVVTLYPRHICETAIAFLSIEITIHRDAPSFICKVSGGTKPEVLETHSDRGVFLAHEPHRTPGGLPAPKSPLCNVYFSLSFLMELSFFKSNHWELSGGSLCHRVASQGTEQGLQASEQMLKLCL